jgi:predicted DNA-binding transcriptional regulator YafY
LIFRGRAYYLIADCHRRKEMRLFRLDRISELIIMPKRFARNPQVSPESFFQYSWELQRGQPVEVELHLSGRAAIVAQSGQHHPTEKLRKLKNGKLEYVATVAGLDEIARWVLGFGGEAVVVTPRELKQLVLKQAETLCEKHRLGS